MAYATGGDVLVRLMATVDQLEETMQQQTQQMSVVVGTMKQNVRLFGRLGKTLTEFADENEREHHALEKRITRLERKASGE
jgi:hypothetical protein